MSMLHLLKFNYLRITVILTLQSMEIDKRSNICHAHQVRGVEPTVQWQTHLRRGGQAAI